MEYKVAGLQQLERFMRCCRPGGPGHPEPRELELFMLSELPRAEVQTIVRHLLAGCTRCSAVTRRLWGGLGDQTLRPPVSPPQPAAETLRLVRGAAR